jgi:hypothetical protein
MKMNKKLVLSVVAFAGMALAAGKTYDLKLYQPAMVGGTELKAGEYRVEVTDDKAVIKGGKVTKEAPVKVETADDKYPTTTVRLSAGEKPQIKEIRLGGTKTKLVFNESAGAAGM